MSHHNLNTDRVMAAAPGPAACLILLSPSHCVVGPDSHRFTISVAEVLVSTLAKVLISLLFTGVYTRAHGVRRGDLKGP